MSRGEIQKASILGPPTSAPNQFLNLKQIPETVHPSVSTSVKRGYRKVNDHLASRPLKIPRLGSAASANTGKGIK